MALSQEQIEQASVLIKLGELSNRAIAKEVGCSESAIRSLIKKGVEKNAITHLVDREIANTIEGFKIEKEKDALTKHEKRKYKEVYFNKTSALNMFDNSTLDNQELVNKAQDEILKIVQTDPQVIIDHLPNLMAIGKMTETNRKQLFGVTETYKPKEGDNNGEIEVIIE